MSESLGNTDDKSLLPFAGICLLGPVPCVFPVQLKNPVVSPLKLRLQKFNLPRVPQLVYDGVRFCPTPEPEFVFLPPVFC